MINELIANELQGINGLLMTAEAKMDRIWPPLQEAPTGAIIVKIKLAELRHEVVILARRFEPPLENAPKCSCNYNPETGHRLDIVCPKHDGVKTITY